MTADHEKYYDTPEEATAEFTRVMKPDQIPQDSDWHWVVTKKRPFTKKLRGMTKYGIDIAFWTGEFWTLGNRNPVIPVDILAWDEFIQVYRNEPITDDSGITGLMEELLDDWHKEYLVALDNYKRNRYSKGRDKYAADVHFIESQCLNGIVGKAIPGVDARSIIHHFRKKEGVPESELEISYDGQRS